MHLERVDQLQARARDAVEDEVHGADEVRERAELTAEGGGGAEPLGVVGRHHGRGVADGRDRLEQEPAGAEARVVDAVAQAGPGDLDHGPDDVARRVELARVSRDLCDVLEQALVDLRERVDVSLGRERQAVDLLDDASERGGPGLVVLDLGEDAPEPLRQRVAFEAGLALGEVAEVREERLVDVGEHVVRLERGPDRPAVVAVQDTSVRFGVVPLEGGGGGSLIGPRGLGVVEGLEEEEPRELLDVVARLDALGAHLVGGVLDGLLDLGAARVGGVVRTKGVG